MIFCVPMIFEVGKKLKNEQILWIKIAKLSRKSWVLTILGFSVNSVLICNRRKQREREGKRNWKRNRERKTERQKS